MQSWSRLLRAVAVVAMLVPLAFAALHLAATVAFDHRAVAQTKGAVPGAAVGGSSDSESWRAIRRGVRGAVSIPNKRAGVMIQSEGENWRAIRNGPVSVYGLWALGGVLVLLLVFFLYRGRIEIEAGVSGRVIERFNGLDRFAHWLTATSFCVLGLTGLNMLYGRYLFAMDPAGDAGDFTAVHKAFAAITYYGKFIHTFIGFSFAVGVVLMIVVWIRHNVPNKHDVVWLAKGGGILVKGVHVPAHKFNAGQKIVFWLVVLMGVSITWSGLGLIFPYQITPFGETFVALNAIGFNLPADLAPLQEMQLTQVWHAIVGLIFIAFIIAHIYIGTLGMEGAFDAMNSGHVDENWAREHHDLWVAELTGESGSAAGGGAGEATRPAE